VGFWESRAQIAKLWQMDRCFRPEMDEATRESLYRGWCDAVHATIGFRVA